MIWRALSVIAGAVEFALAHWPAVLLAVFTFLGWLLFAYVIGYNKGARDHGCAAKYFSEGK